MCARTGVTLTSLLGGMRQGDAVCAISWESNEFPKRPEPMTQWGGAQILMLNLSHLTTVSPGIIMMMIFNQSINQ